jgi:hypothetical protein
VVTAAVPWAQHGSRFSRTFEDQVAWRVTRCDLTAVAELIRIAWRSVGAIIARVTADAERDCDRLAGLRRIGIDAISYRRGQRYLIVVVDHDGGELAWARPVAEYGRIAKTLHLQACIDVDDAYGRQIGAQLNIQESRHQLARRIFHGQRGEMRQRCLEGQEDQLGALGWALNAVVLWNTPHMDLALGQLRPRGVEFRAADVARLSAAWLPAHQLPGSLRFHPAGAGTVASAARPAGADDVARQVLRLPGARPCSPRRVRRTPAT